MFKRPILQPLRLACTVLVLLLSNHTAWAQLGAMATGKAAQPEAPADPLGRSTPRGAVLGFMTAARRGNDNIAPLYLDTDLKKQAAVDLAHKLYIVLDSRLPARLYELSDRPEGSLANPLKPDLDIVGTIDTVGGPLDVTVERVSRGSSGSLWLFSRETLESIPDAYEQIDLVSVDRHLPASLTKYRIGGIRVFEWLVLFLVIPPIYQLLGFLSRPLRPLFAAWHRRYGPSDRQAPDSLPGSIRLLFLAGAIRWLLATLDLPLLERQFWVSVSVFLTIAAVAWILLHLNARAETYLRRRFQGPSVGEVASLLRLARRVGDVLVISISVLVSLYYLGVNATAALAGLGIGGIAVALAAQKTLENVIGGLSLIFDKAVRVGDFLKLGETFGTVDYIGLRSTRIRTLDRTILTVPNGQIANVGIETLSARDKFWFHHFVGLRYKTTAAQMRAVVNGVRKLLVGYPGVDLDSVRVRFLRLGPFSLDIEIFAYVFADDWGCFLEIQEDLLLQVMEVVEKAGTAIAFPSQTLHIADPRVPAAVVSHDGHIVEPQLADESSAANMAVSKVRNPAATSAPR
jgi:MscS family membrane protein